MYLVDNAYNVEYLTKRINMNKTIVIYNKKGGVGKSTLATNLAVEYSKRNNNTILVDLDVSKTSLKFMQRRADLELTDDTLLVAIPSSEEELDSILDEEDSLKIVDVGGFGDELAMSAVLDSDLLIVPINTSPQDRDTTEDFIKMILEMRKTGFTIDTIFVLNNVDYRTNIENLAQSVSYVQEAGFDLYGAVRHYKIFEVSHGQGQSVCEINKDSKASMQVHDLMSAIEKRLKEKGE